MSTQLTTTNDFFSKPIVKEKFNELLGNNAQSFISSVLQVVNSNALLKNADPTSVYSCAIMSTVLKLSINPNLGFAYIIPYNQKFKDEKGIWQSKQVAQFQIGYKGFIQLAQRSGQFKTISSCAIFEGQITSNDPLKGLQFDFNTKTSNIVVGYASYFQLINGFEKVFYMTNEELKIHGKKFSKTFENTNGLWSSDFHSMANKTVIKLLLSKFAPLSIEMEKAIIADQSLIKNAETMEVEYIDNSTTAETLDQSNQQKEDARIIEFINRSASVEQIEEGLYGVDLSSDVLEVKNKKIAELKVK